MRIKSFARISSDRTDIIIVTIDTYYKYFYSCGNCNTYNSFMYESCKKFMDAISLCGLRHYDIGINSKIGRNENDTVTVLYLCHYYIIKLELGIQ